MRFMMPLLIALSLFPSRRLQNENRPCCATKVPDVKLHPICPAGFIGALNRSGAKTCIFFVFML